MRTFPTTMSLWLVTALLAIATGGWSQAPQLPVKKPAPDATDSMTVYFETLKKTFGENKQIPARYEKQVLYALSFFPELAHTRIKFRIKKSTGGIIDTRPTLGGVLRKGNKRQYLITIYDSIAGRTLPTFAAADVNGQAGIVGHELSHILSFQNSTGLGLVGLGIAHLSTRYMDRYENNTDRTTIARGLGYQLLAWKQYLEQGFAAMRRNEPPPSPRTRYLSVAEIRAAMAANSAYQQ